MGRTEVETNWYSCLTVCIVSAESPSVTADSFCWIKEILAMRIRPHVDMHGTITTWHGTGLYLNLQSMYAFLITVKPDKVNVVCG